MTTEQIKYYENKLAHEMDASDLFDSLKNCESVIPLDARKPQAYEAEHIPGAISLPHREMSEESTKHLNKNILYIVYCDGIGCNASTKGALNMAKLGFNVKELTGGLEWWKSDGYATEGTQGTNTATKVECVC